MPLPSISFLLQGLLGSLGLLALGGLGGGGLDDTDSNRLPHVTDREPRGWNTEKGSTHMRNLGLSSVDLPVRRSTFSFQRTKNKSMKIK